jgi:hypothetical protein
LLLGIAIDTSGSIYVCGKVVNTWTVRKSTTGASGSFITIDSFTGSIAGAIKDVRGIATTPNGSSVYVCGYDPTLSGNFFTIRSSPTGASGTFTTIDSYATGTIALARAAYATSIAVAYNGAVYACGGAFATVGPTFQNFFIRGSANGASGSFSTLDFTRINS